MERTEAFRVLRLDPSADGQMVTSAYWNLVRQAQRRATKDVEAHVEIDRLNEAYGTLAPDGKRVPGRGPAPEPASGIPILDAFADWVAREAQRTRVRWEERNPEIGLIGGAVIVLMILALGAGASAFATFVCVGVICAAIWAPWRRVQ